MSEEAPPAPRRCGLVAIVGRPNVGKSTLMNALVGQKISITSNKAQTTRHRITGIRTIAATQFVFVDTPGFQMKHSAALNRTLNRTVLSSIADVDIVLFVVEAGRFGPDDAKVLALLPPDKPAILIANKVDAVRRRDELNEMGVRIRFIGRRDWRVPKRLLRRMDESVALTAANRKLTLTIAFNYGSRAELVDAVKALLQEGADPATIDEADIAKRLYDPEMPDVDLWVRTSGEHRISNYLLWQSAYAEMVFVDTFWPAFRRGDLAGAVAEYQRRDRRFGGLKG